MKKRRYPTQPVDVNITYPTACRYCSAPLAEKAVERTVISKGRDAYTRAPITRHTLLPFCSVTCGNMYQELSDSI